MKLLRSVEVVAWALGGTLLLTYAATRSWYVYGRDQGIANFQALRATDAVDMSAWSQARITRYRASQTARAIPEAVLRIPSLKLVVPVFEGTSEENLNRGAGRIEGTAPIGNPGNIGIAAHRDGFFRVLKDVRVGDELLLDRLDATDTYRIVATSIVNPSEVSVLSGTGTPSVTLVTCYPFYFVGSAPQRFIVRAEKTPAGEKPAGVHNRVAEREETISDDGNTSEAHPDRD
jgi:sortase A